jgi:hypothetical protein
MQAFELPSGGTMVRFGFAATLVVGWTLGCTSPTAGDGGSDAGEDAGVVPDGGPSDAGAPDAGIDAGAIDAGVDAGPTDAGSDAGPTDGGSDAGTDAGTPVIAVTTFGNSVSRSGVYADPAFTKARLLAIAADGGLVPDPSFQPSVAGRVYAQPLFLERGSNGADALFVVTEENNAYAFNATTGAVLWSKNLGPPGRLSQLGCGNIDPLGATGTPALDLVRKQLLLDAVVQVVDGGPSDGGTPHHNLFALDLATGGVNWSLDVEVAVPGFQTAYQNQRSGLLVLNDTLYVPYGGHWGDCLPYYGRVVGVPLSGGPPSAATLKLFQTAGTGAALWAPNAVASDGTSLFACTGNDRPTPATWDAGMGEALLHIALPGITFSGLPQDYFAPNNWQALDQSDGDLGSNGVVLFDLAGAGSGQLAFVIGKTHIGWLLDRTNLGGIQTPDAPLASIADVATDDASGGMVAYQTAQGSYVGYDAPCWTGNNTLAVLQVAAGTPPTLAKAFCLDQGVQGGDTGGSPIVTTTDGHADAVIWGLGVGGDDQLHAYDGDLGTPVVSSSGMSHLTHWIAPVVAKGSMYVAGNQQVYAFRLR